MNETLTSTMLQRIPVILAVTAASYGLDLPTSVARLHPVQGATMGGYARAATGHRAPAQASARHEAARELQAA